MSHYANGSHATNGGYVKYQMQRKQLLTLMPQMMQLVQRLEMKDDQPAMEQVEKNVQTDSFKLLVMGEFNYGKSTLINAMLGQKILTVKITPATAVITEIKWGEQPKALIYHKAIEKVVPPPQLVAVADLDQYIALPEGSAQVKEINESPYQKVELFWNLPLCQQGVELIDSPGLNAYAAHDNVTTKYLDLVDALLFMTACDFPVTKHELNVLEYDVRARGFEDIFFICNRINMVDEEERESVKTRCRKLLAPLTRCGEQHVFFIDARAALKAREQSADNRLLASGLPAIEAALETFLTKEKGRVKLARPIRQMKSIINRARTQIIPDRQALLMIELNQLEANYAKAQKDLAALENQQALIIQQIENMRLMVKSDVQERARQFYRQVAEETVNWVKLYTVQKGLGFRDAFAFKTAVERVVAEVTEHLTNKVKAAASDWQKAELTPLLTRSVAALQNSLEPKLQRFVQQVDEVRMEVTGVKVTVEERETPTWERILAGTAGMLIDPGSAAMGATFGFKGMLSSIIPQTIAIIVGLVITGGVLSPVLLIPMLIAAILNGGFRLYQTEERIKQKIGEEYEKKLRDNRDDLAKKVAEGVDQKLAEVQQAIKAGLTREINEIRTQAESVIQLKKEEQTKVDEARRTLAVARQQADELEKSLDELLGELVSV